MGIPGFLSQLEQYATETTWIKTSSQPLPSGYLIIDGPCFVYWAYRYYVTTYAPPRMQALYPDYDSIGQTAIQLLEEFESFGLPIKTIYFDGLLPEYKTQIRLHRQQRLVHQVKAVKAKHVALDSNFFSQMDCLSQCTPSFLVPSVLETLLSSKYGDRTLVVPGEAEAFCTHSNNCVKDDIILTNDTDSILYNPAGRIFFLAWLEFRTLHEHNDTLRVHSIDCDILRNRLYYDDLRILGFLLLQNPTWTLKECVHEAKRTPMDKSKYSYFQDQYAVEVFENALVKRLNSLSDQNVMTRLLQRLDPRMSEIVHTFCELDSTTPRQMSLPVLLEDISRASSWVPSTHIRTVAYSLLVHTAGAPPNFTSVFEIDRRGERVGQQAVKILGENQLAHECSQITSHLTELTEGYSDLCEGCAFIAYAVQQLNLSHAVSEKPKRSEISLVLNPDYENRVQWTELHLNAQVRAFLYSLRMLRQTVEVLSTYLLTNQMNAGQLLPELQNLHNKLNKMPILSDLFPRPRHLDNVHHAKCRKEFEALFESLAWSVESPARRKKKMTKKTTKKKNSRKR